MATLTIGNSYSSRATDSMAGWTCASKGAASGSGLITSVSLWVTVAGTFDIATFSASGNNYTTRATGSLGALGTGQQNVSGLSLVVQAGDYIGVYSATGKLNLATSGGSGWGQKTGDHIPCVSQAFSENAGWKLNLSGTGTTIPTITSLTENHGSVGDSVVIAGTSFDAAQGAGGVTFNGVAAAITSWADTTIVCTVPAGAATGDVVVTNSTGGVSSGTAFTLDAPAITLLNPDHGAVGDSVTITGTAFEAAQGTGTVTFNGVAGTVTAWSATSITVTVPVGATTGDVVVTNNTGDASAGVTWTLDAVAAAGATRTVPLPAGPGNSLQAGAILGQPVVQA